MTMTYEECLERMKPYLARADSTKEEFDRNLYEILRAITAQTFGLSEDAVEAAARARLEGARLCGKTTQHYEEREGNQ